MKAKRNFSRIPSKTQPSAHSETQDAFACWSRQHLASPNHVPVLNDEQVRQLIFALRQNARTYDDFVFGGAAGDDMTGRAWVGAFLTALCVAFAMIVIIGSAILLLT